MDLGYTSKIGEYYLQSLGSKNAAAKALAKKGGISFEDIVAAKSAQSVTGQESVAGMSFKDRWQARFPGGYYHVMDAYKIPQGIWERMDFPFESFYSDNADESVMNWTPSGPAPSMTDPKVQSRLNSILGQHSIVVPPALEEKLKENPALADKIMANIDHLFAWNGYPIPGRINSALIVLDENGEVARWRLTSGGGITGPTEEEQRKIEAEQAAKRKKREEYARLSEEYALKRKQQAQEENRRYYKKNMEKEAAALLAYQGNIRQLQENLQTNRIPDAMVNMMASSVTG